MTSSWSRGLVVRDNHVILSSAEIVSVHICSDGGANSLYNSLNEEQREKYLSIVSHLLGGASKQSIFPP
jgi:hypothetical protein